jgi:hypothetical protein
MSEQPNAVKEEAMIVQNTSAVKTVTSQPTIGNPSSVKDAVPSRPSIAKNDPLQKESNNLPTPLQNFNVPNSNQSNIAAVLPTTNELGNKTNIVVTNPINNNTSAANLSEPSVNTYAINTVYTDTDESDNNGLLSNEKVKNQIGWFPSKG